MSQAKAIRLLQETLGADVGVRIYRPEGNYAMARRRLTKRLHQAGADPYNWAEEYPKVTIVWETPPLALARTHPSVGRVNRALITGGILPRNINHLWLYPFQTTKQISIEQMATWRPMLREAIEAADAKYIITMGSRTMWPWRPDLKLSEAEGKTFIYRSRHVILPMSNPANLDKHEKTMWEIRMARHMRTINEFLDIDKLDTVCIKCSKPLYFYDPDGVAWCKEHVEAGLKAHEKGESKWRILETASGQASLL